MDEPVKKIDEKLAQFDPITLEEMRGIRLMNRIDTKFLVNVAELPTLLEMAKKGLLCAGNCLQTKSLLPHTLL